MTGGRWVSLLWLIASQAASLTGCHYRLVRAGEPFGAHRIAVPPVLEEIPLGLAPALTAALIDRLRQGGVVVVSDTQKADAVLQGRITLSRTTPSPITSGVQSGITTYRLTVRIEVTLARVGGDTLWSGAVVEEEDFLPYRGEADDPTSRTEANRRRAAGRLIDRAARALHHQLVFAAEERSENS